MSRTMIKNKHIEIGYNNYRLTITKDRRQYANDLVYMVFLSDVDSQFSTRRSFTTINQLEKGLRAWLIESDLLNDPETAVFQQISDWDGVINI